MSEERPKNPRRRWLQFGLRTILLVIFVVAVALAWLTRPETLEEVVAGGALRIERQVIRDGEDLVLNHGRWRLFDADDGPLATGVYSRGEASGTWTILDAASETALRGECRRGKREGLWTAFHPDGTKQYEVTFAAGLPQGPAAGWWPDGSPRWQGAFRDGEREGAWSYWDEAGTLRAQGQYVAGREEGPWRSWDAAGNELPAETYVAGRVVPPDAATILAHWKERLVGDDAAARAEAAWALARIGPPALPALKEVATEGDAAARATAAEVLGTIRPVSPGAVSVLAAALRDDDSAVVRSAAEALRRMGPAAEGALAELRRRVSGETDESLLEELLAATASIAPGDAESIRRLLLLVPPHGFDVDPAGRFAIGEDSAFYVSHSELAPALANAARDADTAVALAAVNALGRMGGSEAVQSALLSALRDPRAEVRLTALQALSTSAALYDTEVMAAIEAVANSDPDSIVRGEAKDALKHP